MKEKDYNLEIIRNISFLSVIIIHIANYYCRAFDKIPQNEYIFSLILDTLARVSVPCFFMISGALLLGRDETLKKHWHRLIRFLIPFIAWSIIYYFWNIYYLKEPQLFREILYFPITEHLWYLYAIIPIYIVLPFFQIMCRHMSLKTERAFLIIITITVIFNYILSLDELKPYYDLPLIGDRVYSYYFFIGYYIYKYKKHIPINQKNLIITFLGSMAITAFLTASISYSIGDHYEEILEYGNPLIILASAAFFLFVLRLAKYKITPSIKTKKIIDLLSGCSFGIYLIHIIFLDIYKNHMQAADLSAWIAIPMLTITIAIIAFVCVWLLRHFKLGRKIT